MRIALIGPGKWGKNYIKTLEYRPHDDLAWVASRGWKEKLKEDSALDAVIIATPTAQHLNVLQECLDRGLPCLVEKPLSVQLGEVVKLYQQADHYRRSGAWWFVNYLYVYHPGFLRLRQRLAHERISRIELFFGQNGPFRRDTAVYWDWGVHVASLAHALLGMHTPKRVQLQCLNGGSRRGRYNLQWLAPARRFAGYPDDVPVQCLIGNNLGERTRKVCVWTTGGARYEWSEPEAGKSTITVQHGNQVSQEIVGGRPALDLVLDYFLLMVRGVNVMPPPDPTLFATRLITEGKRNHSVSR